jgi:hypothetical protein
MEPGETLDQVFRSGTHEFFVPELPGEHKLALAWVGGGTGVATFHVPRPPPKFIGVRQLMPFSKTARKPGDIMYLFGANLVWGCPNPTVTANGIAASIQNAQQSRQNSDLAVIIPQGITSGTPISVRLVCDGKMIGEFTIPPGY